MQQFADNTKKKPVATTGLIEELYLRNRLKHQLHKVEREPFPITRDDWRAYEYLRDLARRFRGQAGGSFWPLAFAGCCLTFMVVLLYVSRPHPLIFSFPVSIRVLHQYPDGTDFLLQQVVDGVAEPPELRRFDEKPPFEQGMTLTWLEVDDRGNYWSVKHINPYFRLLRENGVAALAPNCHHSHPEDWSKDHSVCKGEPQW